MLACPRQQLQLDVVPLLVGLLWKPWGEPPVYGLVDPGNLHGVAVRARVVKMHLLPFFVWKQTPEVRVNVVCHLWGARARYFDCASATHSAGSKFPVLARLHFDPGFRSDVRTSIRLGLLNDSQQSCSPLSGCV